MVENADGVRPGLSSAEAAKRLQEVGPNSVPKRETHPFVVWLLKFWGPVPWMLEATLALELVLGRYAQSIILALLLVLNAIISFAQERRARNALNQLQDKLKIRSRVRRDGTWQLLPAEELVPGDIVHVRVGDFVPADLALFDGVLALDRSNLTGESATVEASAGETAFAGSVVRQGEARGEVVATGPRTSFGRTAELVHSASAPSHLEAVILGMVKYLIALDIFLVAIVLVYAASRNLPLAEMLPFVLILLIAAVPVALPATYTLAGAIGALAVSRHGVLVTRLPALEEAAGMEVLCSDKTGTLTENRLTFAGVYACPSFTEEQVLQAAALASDEATHDPLDLAVLAEVARRKTAVAIGNRSRFLPFDPARKRSEAIIRDSAGESRVIKGAPIVIASLATNPPDLSKQIDEFARHGARVLAVAVGSGDQLHLAGLIGLHDPPRKDAAQVIQRLGELGIRVIMVTGDNAATARAIADQVGIKDSILPAAEFRGAFRDIPANFGVLAGVYPEDKFRLVQALQLGGKIVGMTGDGVNDAPALRQAEVGVAVAGAVDVAKSAAGMVLTRPGLTELIEAVLTGRTINQRMLTYTLNKIVKTILISLLLAVGLLVTGQFVTTPRHILVLLFVNDFVTMSLAGDRVRASLKPDKWDMRGLSALGLGIAAAWLVLIAVVALFEKTLFDLTWDQLQTTVFLLLVLTGYANVFLVRERRAFWASCPGTWLLVSMAGGLTVAFVAAAKGILMSAIPIWLIVLLAVIVVAYLVMVDRLKIIALSRFVSRS
jgi:H+-transporting ATPase